MNNKNVSRKTRKERRKEFQNELCGTLQFYLAPFACNLVVT